jgi:hypothetical protein
MALQIIRTDPELSSYTQRTVLDGREYILGFQWNQRAEKWSLSIYDQDGSPIALGLKLVANFPVTRRITDSRGPFGTIFPLDTSGEGRDPGLRDLGRRVLLVYLEASDLEDGSDG